VAVTYVKPEWGTLKAHTDSRGVTTFTVRYLVLTDSLTDDQVAVGSSPFLPRLFTRFVPPSGAVDTSGAYLQSLDPEQSSESPFIWYVTAFWSSEREPNRGAADSQDSQKNPDPDPTKWAKRRNWSLQKFTKPLEFDILGFPVHNTAGDPIDIEVEEARPRLVISRNEPYFDPDKIITYKDKLNLDPFYGAFPYCVKCDSISADEDYEAGRPIWRVRYEFSFKADTWLIQLQSRGLRCLVGGRLVADRPTAIIDDSNGSPVSQPVGLKDNGDRALNESEIATVSYQGYEAIEFAPLRLE